MKIRADRLDAPDMNTGGEKIVESELEVSGGQTPFRRQVGHLPQGVYPGIGPPRPLDVHLASQQPLRSLHEGPLDRAGIRLTLPPPIARPIVFDGQLALVHTKTTRTLSR